MTQQSLPKTSGEVANYRTVPDVSVCVHFQGECMETVVKYSIGG